MALQWNGSYKSPPPKSYCLWVLLKNYSEQFKTQLKQWISALCAFEAVCIICKFTSRVFCLLTTHNANSFCTSYNLDIAFSMKSSLITTVEDWAPMSTCKSSVSENEPGAKRGRRTPQRRPTHHRVSSTGTHLSHIVPKLWEDLTADLRKANIVLRVPSQLLSCF